MNPSTFLFSTFLVLFASLAVSTDARIIGWGDPAGFGQIPTYTDLVDPSRHPFTTSTITKAQLCGTSILILTDSGRAVLIGTVAQVYPPGEPVVRTNFNVSHPSLRTIVDIACSSGPAPGYFATNASGAVMSWGENVGLRLGHGSDYWTTTPLPMLNQAGVVTKVIPTFDVTALLLSNGTIQFYGRCGPWCRLSVGGFETNETGYMLEFPIRSILDMSIHRAPSGGSIVSILCLSNGEVQTAGVATAQELMRSTPDQNYSPVATFSRSIACKKVFTTTGASFVLGVDGSVWSSGASGVSGRNFSNIVPLEIRFNPTTYVRDMFLGQYNPGTAGRTATMVVGLETDDPQQAVHMWGQDSFTATATGVTPIDPASFFPARSSTLSRTDPIVFFTSDDHFAIAISRAGKTFVWGVRSQTTVYGLPPPDSFDTPQIVPFSLGPVPAASLRTSSINGDCGTLGLNSGRVWSFFIPGIPFVPVLRSAPPVSASSALISFPSTSTPRSIVFPPFDWAPYMITEQAEVYTYLNRNGRFDGPDAGRNFTLISQNILQLLLYSPRQHIGDNSTSQMYLTVNGELFYNGTIPWPGAVSNPTSSGLNQIPMANVLPLGFQDRVFGDMYGRFGWFWFRDQAGELWGIGRNTDFQLCIPSNASTITPAVRFSVFDPDSSRNLSGVDVIKVIPILQNENINSRGGTILVTSRSVILCGAISTYNGNGSLVYNPPVITPLSSLPPSMVQPDRVIVDASFGYYGALLKLDNDEVWAYGYPHPAGVWIPMHTRGALQGRVADSISALPLGGYLISSTPYVEAMDDAYPRNYVYSAPYLDIPGASFGTWGDGLGVSVALYAIDPRFPSPTPCNSTPSFCQPTERTLRNIRCVPTTRASANITTKIELYASITIDGAENTGCTRVAYVLAPPALRDAVGTKIAQNADELVIFGSNLWSDCRISLDVGTCQIINVTETEVRCRLTMSAAAVGSSVRATVSVIDQFEGNTQVIVATIVPAPTVDSSSNVLIPPGTVRLEIHGSGFNADSPTRNFVRIRVDQQPYTNCTVSADLSNSTVIVCDLVNTTALNITSGTVYAIVRSFNGFSEERAIGTLSVAALPPPTPPSANRQTSGSSLNVPGLIGGVAAAVVVIIILIIVIVVLIRRRRITDVGQLDVPQEMASMFNIKSTDLQMKQKIGEGSFGAVFLCSYKGEDVALKKLTSAMISTHVSDFFREAATMTGIKPHKNIVRIYGLCQETNNFSLVMEYLPLGSLDAYAAKVVPKGWDERTLYRVVLGVARGMAHLAGEGIVHRDLAARNILLSENCDPKISDFGMSRMVGGEDGQGQTASNVGPIKWMPPESIATRSYSEKSDVWSYAVLLFEVTTALAPFDDEDLLQVAVDVRDTGRTVLTKAPSEVLKKIPEYIMEIMKDCFQKDAKLRPTFHEIVSRLEAQQPAGYVETEQTQEPKSKGGKKGKRSRKNRDHDDAEAVEMAPRPDGATYTSLPDK